MSKGITRERTGQLLQALFRVLIANPDGIQAREAIDNVAEQVALTDHEAGEYETGGRRFDKILRFATVDAVKAGWMTKNKGVWAITDAGTNALTKFKNPEEFYREASRLYRKWRQSQPDEETIEDSSQEKAASITLEEVG